jgi:hypothetical protein
MEGFARPGDRPSNEGRSPSTGAETVAARALLVIHCEAREDV